MRTRLGRWASPSFALAMAGAILLGPASMARATLTLVAVETGGPTLVAQDNAAAGTVINAGALGVLTTTVSDSTATSGTLTLGNSSTAIPFGDFTVLGSISTSNSPGSIAAQLLSNSLAVTNTTGTTHTIDLKISDNGYTSPANPLFTATANGGFATVSGGGSVSGDTANAKAFASFANTLFGTNVTIQNFSFTAGTGTLDSYSNTVASAPGGASIPYSMTVELIFTLAGGNILTNRGDGITASAVVPEPATLAMAFSILPMIGLAAWRRRRQSA